MHGRRARVAALIGRDQTFSTRVEEKLRKHREKGATMTMTLYGDENGEFEVHVPDEYVSTSRDHMGLWSLSKGL